MGAVGAIATALAWIGGPKPAQLGSGTTGDAALAAAVRELAGDPKGYRGLSVALVEDGAVRFAGLGDGGGAQIDPDTAFEIGSVGKALTGMLLADLIGDGTVDADEPLRAQLPDVTFTDQRLADTTLAELASHRAGLPPVRITGLGHALGTNLRFLRGHDPYAGADSTWLMSTVAGAQRSSDPEPGVRYSNYGFAVLGQALATRAGIPYPELVAQRVFDPLGMASTSWHLDGAVLPDHRAHGGTANGRPVAAWQGSGYAPAGVGLWSTARDLATLVSAMLAGTAPGADAATGRFPDPPDTRVGYGWFTTSVDGQEITWHNGGTGGFRSFVGFDPAAGRGVVVLGNTDHDVDHIGMGLVTTEARGGGSSGGGAGLLPVAMTLGLSLIGGLSLLFGAVRSKTDRLRLVSGGVGALAALAIAYRLGAWASVPTLVWAVGGGLAAAAAVLAVRRWRHLPLHIGHRGWWRWSGTALSSLTLSIHPDSGRPAPYQTVG